MKKVFFLFFLFTAVILNSSCFLEVGEDNPDDPGATPVPEIVVKQGSNNIADGSGSYNFGSIVLGATAPSAEFTIKNLGMASLSITGIEIDDVSNFTIDDSSTLPAVSENQTTSFSINFIPQSADTFSAKVTIHNNDNNEGEFTFTVTGSATPKPEPEINVKQGDDDIADGSGSYDFGSIEVSSCSSSIEFTVENNGTADLDITSVSILNDTESNFSIDGISTPVTVTQGSNTSFTVTFCPQSEGEKSAILQIENNDSDEETFTFTIIGIGNDGIQMVSVPSGTFQMGYDGVVGATPVHQVTLSSFYMGKYEVTNAQVVEVFNWANGEDKFASVDSTTVTNIGDNQELLDLDSTNCHIEYSSGTFSVKIGLGDDGYGGSVDLSNYPCIEISWYGAVAFCNYLSEMEGMTPCYDLSDWSCNFSNNGYRLPTEAEWEYAARYIDGSSWLPGNHASGDETGYCYPIDGGESTVFGDYAWYGDNSGTTPHSDLDSSRGTHEVGTKAANKLGIYDMSGNVWEWSYDWYGSYGSDSEMNPTGPISGTYLLIRGGVWSNSSSVALLVSFRGYDIPSNSHSNIGFRAARTY